MGYRIIQLNAKGMSSITWLIVLMWIVSLTAAVDARAEYQDLLVNGDFDDGPGPPWSEDDGGFGYPIVVSSASVAPHTEEYLAWFGGVNDGSMALGQDLFIPMGVTEPHLTGFIRITTEEPVNVERDLFYIEILSLDDEILFPIATWTNKDHMAGWEPFNIPLPHGFAGQSIRLRFRSVHDLSYETNFFVDSLILTAFVPPDLSVLKSGPSVAIVGQSFSYYVTVSNDGPVDAPGVELRDELPPGMTLVAAYPSQGTCTEQGGVVTCDLLDVPAGSAVTVELQVHYDQALASNTATVSSLSGDADTSNNHADMVSEISCTPTSGVSDRLPRRTGLSQNTPNPFNPTTTIPFSLSSPGLVRINIYDARGGLVKTLLSRRFEAGSYSEEWDGRDDRGRMMASGIYYFDMIVDASKVETRSAVMLK